MELYLLNIEGTKQEILLNRAIETPKALDSLEDVLELLELNLEPSIKKVGEDYITTKANAKYFNEAYGWLFSSFKIAEL